MKILLVDESKVVLEELSKLLQIFEGVEVIGQTQDEDEAVRIFRSTQPDIIFLDVRLEKGSGINVLKTIKKEKSTAIVFMLTNHILPQYRKECLKHGADYFYDKSKELPQALRKFSELYYHAR